MRYDLDEVAEGICDDCGGSCQAKLIDVGIGPMSIGVPGVCITIGV